MVFLALHNSARADRSLYIDNFSNILGVQQAEDSLLEYASKNRFQTLILYDLHIIHANVDLTNPNTNQILTNFILKAKNIYNLNHIAATAENPDFFINVIDAYNNSRSNSNEKFDIYNLEFEFWNSTLTGPGDYYCTNYLIPNGLSCNNDGAFQYYYSILGVLDSLSNSSSHPISIESYLGWPTTNQIDSLCTLLDKVLIHAYVTSPNLAFDYTETRLQNFAYSCPNIETSIIFSSEPQFMQSWLEANHMINAEFIYNTDWQNNSQQWANNISLTGFTYFTQSLMDNVSLGNNILLASHQIAVYRFENQDYILFEGSLSEYEISTYDINNTLIETININDLNSYIHNISPSSNIHKINCINNSNGNLEVSLILDP